VRVVQLALGIIKEVFAYIARLFDRSQPIGSFRRVHALSLASDTMTTVALAGSLFFSISPHEAKSKVALYLALTVLPYAFVAPLLAPLLDRDTRFREGALYLSATIKVVAVFAMSFDYRSLFLFPEALMALVASKLYLVAKASLVPQILSYEGLKEGKVEDSPDSVLVKTNSQLSLLGAVVGVVAGALAGGILKTPGLGTAWILRAELIPLLVLLAEIRFMGRTHLAHLYSARGFKVSKGTSSPKFRDHHVALVASTAIAVLRAGVGFFTFLVAFQLKESHSSVIIYGLTLLASASGAALATAATPLARRRLSEQQILVSALVIEALAAIAAGKLDTISSQIALAGIIGLVASGGKLAFDSIVQHHVSPNLQARAFARYETRLQLAWVIGAIVPTLIYIPLATGDVVVATAALVGAFSFSASRRALSS
jgi:hypothetical protein